MFPFFFVRFYPASPSSFLLSLPSLLGLLDLKSSPLVHTLSLPLTFYLAFFSCNPTGLLVAHNWSPAKLLSSIYPNYPWVPWKWLQVPKGFWDNIENQQKANCAFFHSLSPLCSPLLAPHFPLLFGTSHFFLTFYFSPHHRPSSGAQKN